MFLADAAKVRVIADVHAEHVDAEARFPVESLASLRRTPLLGLVVPAEMGGPGGDLFDLVAVAQELARSCLATSFIWAMHCQQVDAIVRFADPALQATIIPDLLAGRTYLASVTTEPGSDRQLLHAEAAAVPANGELAFCRASPIVTGVRHADAFLVTMRASPTDGTNHVTLVYAQRSQVRIVELAKWDTLGMRGTESNGVVIEGSVPSMQVVGSVGGFRTIAVESYAAVGHIGWAAAWIGAAREATRRVVRALNDDARARRALSDVRTDRLARARHELELAQALLAVVTHNVDRERRLGRSLADPGLQIQINALKVTASELAFSVVDTLIEVVGLDRGYRRTSSLRLEAAFRDLRSATLNYGNDRLRLVDGHLQMLDRGIHLAGDTVIDGSG